MNNARRYRFDTQMFVNWTLRNRFLSGRARIKPGVNVGARQFTDLVYAGDTILSSSHLVRRH